MAKTFEYMPPIAARAISESAVSKRVSRTLQRQKQVSDDRAVQALQERVEGREPVQRERIDAGYGDLILAANAYPPCPFQSAAAAQRKPDGDKEVVQQMRVRGAAAVPPSQVKGVTHNKHVVAGAIPQAAAATANYGDTTFVAADNLLTAPVDADNHNFLQANLVRSPRLDINANVVIDQWDKPGGAIGMAPSTPAEQTIFATATLCEIGVVKTGADRISIEHFKKL